MDPIVLRTFDEPLSEPAGTAYVAKICGRQRADRLWEGWVEFVPEGGSPVLRSRRETTQPSARLLEGWAERLSRTYLEGALERTLHNEIPRRGPRGELREVPYFEGPAPVTDSRRRPAPDDAPLNPFLHFDSGEDVLAGELEGLSAADLRIVIRAYDLDATREGVIDTDALDKSQLADLILSTVRTRMSA